jgi:lipopolysaccharide transport system permease protein
MVIERPLLVIAPSRRWVALDLGDIWSYRELLYFLAWRDVKVRYKQTALGVGWAVLQPFLTMVIFTIVFGRVAHVPSDGHPYALFALAGVLPWTFLANAITNSSNSLVTSSNLIGKVYFPRLIMPCATVLAAIVDLGFAFLLLFAFFAYERVTITANLLLLPLLVVMTTLLALAVGIWFAALNVKYRDIRYALPFLIQLGMFATPIIYPASMVPQKWHWLMTLNPMAGIVEGYRASLLGGRFDWMSLGIAGALTLFALAATSFYFRSVEKSFADLI